MSLSQIQDCIIDLHFDWRSISILINIEKFNIQWSSIKEQESRVFENYPDIFTYEQFLVNAKEGINLTHANILEDFDTVRFWFDTELEIHQLVKCLLFAYFIQPLLASSSSYSGFGFQAAKVLLFESGYT